MAQGLQTLYKVLVHTLLALFLTVVVKLELAVTIVDVKVLIQPLFLEHVLVDIVVELMLVPHHVAEQRHALQLVRPTQVLEPTVHILFMTNVLLELLLEEFVIRQVAAVQVLIQEVQLVQPVHILQVTPAQAVDHTTHPQENAKVQVLLLKHAPAVQSVEALLLVVEHTLTAALRALPARHLLVTTTHTATELSLFREAALHTPLSQIPLPRPLLP